MIKPIIYGSVCSGIEAATVAWHPLGWKASFFSEIEKFPCSVLKHHYPETPLHGDFTTIQNNQYDAINLLVGGTPCQAFSVAGLRKGLDDPRGNLTLSFIGLAERLHPKWIVWENVPGVLSIDRGRAFGAFLGGLAKIGYGFAYRILDAQYFGVPQRRRRVFVVGYLGDYRRAAAVLFEREGLCRHSPPRREARKENASNARGCTSVSSGHGYWSQSDVAGTIRSQDSVTKCDTLYVPPVAGTLDKGIPARGAGNAVVYQDHLIAFSRNDDLRDAQVNHTPTMRVCGAGGHLSVAYAEVSPTLKRDYGQGYGDCEMDAGGLVGVSGDAYSIAGNIIDRNPETGGNGDGVQHEVSYTLTKNDKPGVCHPIAVDTYNQTLNTTSQAISSSASDINHTGGVLVPNNEIIGGVDMENNSHGENDPTGPLLKGSPTGGGRPLPAVAIKGMAVRRLTPVECERLQGFPDGYTDIKLGGKPTPDGPRYKALGNSMAVPVMNWIGRRIQIMEELIQTNQI